MDDFNSGTAMECFKAMCLELQTPLAYKMHCLLKDNNLEEVLKLRINPAKYGCAKTLLIDQQLVSFFKKYEDLPFSNAKKREKAAIDLFWESERACFVSNHRLTPLLDDPYHYGERMQAFLQTWRKKIKRVLGRAPSWDLVDGKFGNGATFGNKGNLTSVADKLTDYYTVTKIPRELVQDWDKSAWSRYAACGMEPFAPDHESHDPHHQVRDFVFVRGNRLTTVPKQWDKDRGICIEPSINVFYQLGIGRLLAKCMKRSGLDKRTAQISHKNLACIASLTGACATIDLSNASDTVCEVLIRLLLPEDWWQLLTAVRATHTLIGEHWVRLEKFSSMGNGYTFELETLVFWTLGLTVAELEGVREDPFTPGLTVSAYGDDIIVPTSIAVSVVSALKFFGFQPNLAKTFLDGPFRESCGGDYYRGFDVRPFYLKENLNENHRYIAAANGLRRTRLRGTAAGLEASWLVRPWRLLKNALPTYIRKHCIGPVELGDLVLHDDHWERQASMRVRHSIRYLRVWRPVMNRGIPLVHFRPGVRYAAKLYGDTQVNELNTWDATKVASPFVPKIHGTFVSGYKLGWVPYS